MRADQQVFSTRRGIPYCLVINTPITPQKSVIFDTQAAPLLSFVIHIPGWMSGQLKKTKNKQACVELNCRPDLCV